MKVANRSGGYKLIDKEDRLISLLAHRFNLTVHDYVRKTGIWCVNKIFKLHS